MRTRNARFLSAVTLMLALLVGFGYAGYTQAPQGVIVVPPSDQIQVDISLPKTVYQVGEEIQIFIQTNAPSVSYVYLNVVDIDAAGRCTLIFPNAFSPNPLVPVGAFVIPDNPSLYRLRVVPPAGTEYLQAFASLDPLDLRQLFNAPSTPGTPFPTLCTNPAEFVQQVQGAIAQGIIAEARFATDWVSFQVVDTQGPPPPPPNRPPVAQFSLTPPTPTVGQPVSFTSTSFDPDPGDFIVQHLWNFGDGTTAQGATVFHTYTAPGTYQVTLTVTDNRGASSVAVQTVTVLSAPQPPPLPPTQVGFYIRALDDTRFLLTVQGDPSWLTARPYQIFLETDGAFVSVEQQIVGNVAPQGIVPVPANQTTLTLSGAVASGRVDYIIGVSPTATKVKFDLRLDWNGDGIPERRTDFVYIGSQLRHPPSNPFVLSFAPGGISLEVQICLVLVDVPGFQFIICFRFGSL